MMLFHILWVYISVPKYQCEEVQMVLDGSKLMNRSGMCLVICGCMSSVHASSKAKVLLLFDWLSRCTHVLVVLCEVAIVLHSKSINLFRDAATGPNLSLTTNHMCISHSLDFGSCVNYPDAETAFDCVASVNSPSM